MKSKLWIVFLFLIFWAAGGVFLFTRLENYIKYNCDDDHIVEINRIRSRLSECDSEEKLASVLNESYLVDFYLLDEDGNPFFRYDKNGTLSKEEQTFSESLRSGEPVISQKVLGKESMLVPVLDRSGAGLKKYRVFFAVFWSLSLVPLWIALLFYRRVKKDILEPFERMKFFAKEVAAGNLDLPLQMENEEYFGAYTESFDIMREEIKKSREQEYRANVSKKELVATLSHDMKTPISSMKVMTEVLLARLERGNLDEEEAKDKLLRIYGKLGQIDTMISDMFQSTLQELGEMKVTCQEVSSVCLLEILDHADYEKKLTAKKLPECLLFIDEFRMAQVFGNIIQNSYKYADTRIFVDYEIQDGFLVMKIKDEGPGVPPQERERIFQKFYRGMNDREKVSGTGLGLYICKELMEAMDGGIECIDQEKGFGLLLYIPLV